MEPAEINTVRFSWGDVSKYATRSVAFSGVFNVYYSYK